MKAKLQSLEQTEKVGLFTICFEGEILSEFGKFIEAFKNDAVCQNDLRVILGVLHKMITTTGFLERLFRPEGKMRDGVCALPIETGKLRLYCLRLSDSILIIGNGGRKSTKTYNEDKELSGYVISLQKLDDLIKVAMRKGEVTIEETTIKGLDNITFDL